MDDFFFLERIHGRLIESGHKSWMSHGCKPLIMYKKCGSKPWDIWWCNCIMQWYKKKNICIRLVYFIIKKHKTTHVSDPFVLKL